MFFQRSSLRRLSISVTEKFKSESFRIEKLMNKTLRGWRFSSSSIVDSVFIRENTGQWKLELSHILPASVPFSSLAGLTSRVSYESNYYINVKGIIKLSSWNTFRLNKSKQMVQPEKNISKSVNVILQAFEFKIKCIQCMFPKRMCWNLYLIFLKY